MFKKILAVAILAITTGCATTMSPIVNTTDLKEIDFSTMSLKEGEDCATYWFGIGPFGTAKVSVAARAARIKKVLLVNNSFKFNLVSWSQCVTVQGQ
jgi:hypothetical protein